MIAGRAGRARQSETPPITGQIAAPVLFRGLCCGYICLFWLIGTHSAPADAIWRFAHLKKRKQAHRGLANQGDAVEWK